MKKVIQTTLVALLCVMVSCKVEPEQINFGTDACHFCKMTIVDEQHAAQYVTDKGKQFKYDAIECLVNELAEKKPDNVAVSLVADYKNPGKMTAAIDAIYLISPEIKSPMGANLSAFSSEKDALSAKENFEGTIYSWTELLTKFDAE